MGQAKNGLRDLIIVIFLMVVSFHLCIWIPAISMAFSSFDTHRYTSSNMTKFAAPKDELEVALEGASMGNKTVIIAIVNKAYVSTEKKTTSMLDLFLESFWLGEDTQFLLDHLLLVTMDHTSFNRCKFRRLHCYKLVTDGVDFEGEKLYMSDDFIKMMWRRTLFLAEVLKRGYSFIFTDIDVMWLRNPFLRLSPDEGEDMQMSCDIFNGTAWSEDKLINTGFYFVRSNNKTISLFDTWYGMKDNSKGMKEQDVLINMIQRGVLKQLGLKVRFLDTLYFSGFCKDSKDFRAVVTVHANCCRSMNAKIIDLLVTLKDWKSFKGSMNDRMNFKWSKHLACIKSWITIDGSSG